MNTQSIPVALIDCFEDFNKASQRYRNAFKNDDLDDDLICELRGDLRLFYNRLLADVALPSAALQIVTTETLSPDMTSLSGINDELMDSAIDNLITITMNTILENVLQNT